MEYTQLPTPVAAEEALRGGGITIDVPNGATERFGPFERKYAEGFRVAKIATFKDLQVLGFVPQGLRQEQAMQALRADERMFREAAVAPALQRPLSHGSESGCQCSAPHGRGATPRRRQFQNALIDQLQPLASATLSHMHPMVLHTYRHLTDFGSRTVPWFVGLFVCDDINIGDNATLVGTPTVGGVYARNINIGKEGRLTFMGGSVKVRCLNLNGPPGPLRFALPGLTREFVGRGNQ